MTDDTNAGDDLHFHPDVAFEYLMTQTKPVAGIGGTLVNLIKSELPDATSKLYQGIPVWMVGDQPTVGIKAAKEFVSLMFFRGQRIDDASKALVASGSFEMATVKYHSSEEIDEKQVRGWLRQAASNDGPGAPAPTEPAKPDEPEQSEQPKVEPNEDEPDEYGYEE